MSIDISILTRNTGNEKKKNIRFDMKNILTKDISVSLPGTKNNIRYHIFNELGILLNSGIDLKSALDIIYAGAKKKHEKKVLTNLTDKIKAGQTLSQAMKTEALFSPYEYYSVMIGEESGRLSEIAGTLAGYYDKRIRQNRQIKSALTYPVLVIMTTLVTIGFMVKGIIPMFENVYTRFQGDLPALTKSILKFSNQSPKYLTAILILLAAIFLLIIKFKNNNNFRRYSSSLVLHIPVIKRIVLLSYKSRFCQTFYLLVSSKVHLSKTIELIYKMIDYYPLEKALLDIKDELSKGSSMANAMKNHKIFDRRMISLTKVAEEVNQLDLVYSQLFNQYSEELAVSIKALNTVLEPLLIILIGSVVAFLLIAMYLPIFQIGTGIG